MNDFPVLLLPVYDDWKIVGRLLLLLNEQLAEAGIEADVLLVDDGTACPVDLGLSTPMSSLRTIQVLELRRNLGHQRAIAIGLTWIHEQMPGRAVVVMDADGEDDPGDVPRLLDRLRENGGRSVVFAARRRRSEGFVFRLSYLVYVFLHRLATGRGIRFGNFSAVPHQALSRLVVTSEIWLHYAAAVVNTRVDYETIPTNRAPRLGGRSSLGFTALVIHGLSAISVYGHVIAVRLFLAMAGFAALVTLTAGVWFVTAPAGVLEVWLPFVALGGVAFGQVLVILGIFVVTILGARLSSTFLPIRDYRFFVAAVHTVDVPPRTEDT